MTALELIKSVGIYKLSDCAGAGCPCGHCYIMGIDIYFHCWRNNCRDCEFSGVNIKQHWDFNYSDSELNNIGNEVINQLKEVWSNTDWKLVIINKDL